MMDERRQTEGVAIVTRRAAVITAHCATIGMRARVLAVQDGPAWPELRPPAVLDTVGLPVEKLIALLASPPHLRRRNGSEPHSARALGMSLDQMNRPPLTAAPMPLVALVDSDDWRTLRLLPLCPAVWLISDANAPSLRLWAQYLNEVIRPDTQRAFPLWLVPEPPPLPGLSSHRRVRPKNALEPLLLPILAALCSSPSYADAALCCAVSESTVARTLRTTRAVLGLPSGDVSRFPPAELAALILERLGADAPVPLYR